MSRSVVPSKRSADAQEAAWVADEDRFALQQAKKKAAIRLKGGRAQPVDWLVVTLAVIDPENNSLGDDLDDVELDPRDPESVFEGLTQEQLRDLEKAINGFLALETTRGNQEYWNTMKMICNDRIRDLKTDGSGARGVNSIAVDVDKLLGPKTLAELEKLEGQIKTKLSSNGPIDTDYWEHLLKSLLTYKAKAKLRGVSKSVLNARLNVLRKHQVEDAVAFQETLRARLDTNGNDGCHEESEPANKTNDERRESSLDPEPMLRLQQEDKSLDSITDEDHHKTLDEQRNRVVRRGYIQLLKRPATSDSQGHPAKRMRTEADSTVMPNISVFDREVARGLGDNEEIFTAEEPVDTKNKAQWAQHHRPRKPRYFNRVQLGYEWNKYNQTHYDHDNPPPKVVQGYKFNIFYPDLVDVTKAPTYRMERENGRKRGQTFARAGEDDTCLIRFTAGPPYEDIAFRIIDREWDFSAKRERGFKSSFDKGILQLHFQFKKIYYRK